jgi:RNA polymerase sigma factor (sigma-70 family)
MADPPKTRVSLLARLKSGGDDRAWEEFVELYAPVIYGFARKRGLQDADAADLMQEVLRSVARNASRMDYDPRRGTFRGWLYTVTRNKIYNFLSGQKHRPRAFGDTNAQERLDALPDASIPPDADWEREYQRQLSAQAMEIVRNEFHANSWKAFWGTAVEGRSANDVGQELGMSPGAVYVAKSRIIARLREVVQRLRAETDE